MAQLTPRDRDMLETLLFRVRVLTAAQVGRTWWSASRTSRARALLRLKALAALGLVELYEALSHPELSLPGAHTTWRPGERAPHFGKLSYRLKRRWSLPPICVHCCVATSTAAGMFGGFGGRRPRATELSHDIHLSGVYLRLRRESAALAAAWRSEALQYHENTAKNRKLPDALLVLPGGRRAIEFGGAYGAAKLKDFHDYCDAEHLPYEVW